MTPEEALKQIPDKKQINVDDVLATLPDRSMLSKFAGVMPQVAKSVASAVAPELTTALEGYQTPEIREPIEKAMAIPYQGLRGLATTATSGLQRGAEAVKPDFKPEGFKEHAADFAASMADPRNLALNPVAGQAFGAAKKVAAPVGQFLGKQAANAVQVATGVPAENVLATAKKPMEVLFSKFAKNSGKLFQKAKDAAGVTPAEERLIAGIGDPSGFKRVADDMAEKFAENADLTVGEALAWKKAAGELARKAKGSARFIYSQDAKEAEKIIANKAPSVLKAQKEVALSKTRESFMHLLPRNKGATPAVLRSGVAMGAGIAGSPLAALAMSPVLSALPLSVGGGLAAKGATKGLNVVGENPVARQALLALLSKLKGNGNGVQ